MSQYPGGVTRNELEKRISSLRADINRLLANKVDATVRTAVVQIAGQALDSATWAALDGKPSTFPPTPHGHAEADIADLDKYTQAQVDSLVTGAGIDLTDVDGGEADSYYVHLAAANGGDAAETAFSDGTLNGGGA